MKRVDKVFAYITSNDRTPRLLVFSHPDAPEAGIQVPAGTLDASETREAGVMREAYEETGLAGLQLRAYLGSAEYDLTSFGRAEIHVRHFFHVHWPHPAGASWIHEETSGGKRAPIRFELFWVPFPHEAPALIAGHGALLSELANVR